MFCAAGGFVAAVFLLGTLVLTEMSDFPTVRMALPVIGEYVLIEIVFGFAAVVTPESIRNRLLQSCVTLAKYTWRRRGQVVVATVVAQLTIVVGVWLHSRLFPTPSVYVHVDAPRHSVRSTRLPDENQVILSPGSHLSYTSWFAPHDERELTLQVYAFGANLRSPATAGDGKEGRCAPSTIGKAAGSGATSVFGTEDKPALH